MRIYLMGAENPTWRRQLVEDYGTSSVGFSFPSLKTRLPKKKTFLFSERVPEHVSIALEIGDIEKRNLNHADLMVWISTYVNLVEDNAKRLSLVTDLDTGGPELRAAVRDELAAALPVGVLHPIWKPEDGTHALEDLMDSYRAVSLPAESLEHLSSRNALRAILRGWDGRVHGLGTTKPEELAGQALTSASSTSWTSPSRYGDTIVWDGRALRRYPAKYKDQARKRHRTYLEREGFDSDAIANDDPYEITRLAVWSFMQLETSMAREIRRPNKTNITIEERLATISSKEDDNSFTEPPPEDIATEDNPPRKPDLLPSARNESDIEPSREPVPRGKKGLLPVLGVTAPEDDDGTETAGIDYSGGRTLLQCDTCHVRDRCPEMQPGADCAFDIPVRLRTQADMNKFMYAMLEIQGKRVLFGRFTEELDGGYPDPNVSSELDRFMNMTEKMKNIQDNREYVKFTAETRGQSNILSRLFGSRVGDNAQALEAPVDANALTAGIIDVEEE